MEIVTRTRSLSGSISSTTPEKSPNGPVNNIDKIADLIGHFDLPFLYAKRKHFLVAERDGLALRAYKARNAARIANDVPSIV